MPARDETEEIEKEPAAGRTYRFWRFCFRFYWRQVGETEPNILQAVKNKESEAGKRDGAVAAHEAVVSHFHKACWQDMLEKAPDELDDIERGFAVALAAFLAIGEGDVSIFDGHDSGIGDSHPEDIGGKVFQGCFAVAYGLTVDIPGNLPT